MAKYSVNLLISKKEEPKLIKKLKVVFPIAAAATLIFFVITFIGTMIYVNANISKFNLLQKETQRLEKKVSDQKGIEGIYTVTLNRLNTIDQLIEGSNNYEKLLTEVNNLNSVGITISSVDLDNKGNLNFGVIASSSSTLDDFVNLLLAKENSKLFSAINSQGVIREKKGEYHINLTLKSSKSLLQ